MRTLGILIIAASCFFSCKDKTTVASFADSVDVTVVLEVVDGSNGPVLDKNTPGNEDNKYGLEGGTVIQRPDGFHLFSAEMVGDPRWVKMKLAHWLSKDGKDWKRISTVYESSGDFTGKDPRAALWSPMPFFHEKDDRWNFYYVGYRSQPDSGEMWFGNYEGRIYRAVSKTKGIEGLDGPYEDVGVILEPGKDSDPWEGLQGTDSFFPYLAADGKYYGFYGTAQTQLTPTTLWQIGLASAEKPEGPWKRCTVLNPLDNGLSFAENPVVTKLDNGLYVAVVDAGYDSLGLFRSAIGYLWSKDGIHWSKERLCYLQPKITKWWSMMRTPLCLIKDKNDLFTIFFTAYGQKDGFGSVGMLKVKLTVDTVLAVKVGNNRSYPTHRMNADDLGIVLHYGDGPDSCDFQGVNDAWVYKANDSTFAMHYDAASSKGWLVALATSKDLIHWDKKGKVLDFGNKGEPDSKIARYGTTYYDGQKWHMFYQGLLNTSHTPDYIPSFPYLNMKAEANSPFGPWTKKIHITPFGTKDNPFYSSNTAQGSIVKSKGEYMMFFSAGDYKFKRTIGIARTNNLDGHWQVDSMPILSTEEQIVKTSLYFEEANKTWFLFTNHIAYDKNCEYTDAIWVYWSKDINKWNAEDKAIVLDGQNCKWSHRCIGNPSVVEYKNRLAIFYDAPGENSTSHLRRSEGVAFLNLPLMVPRD